MSISQLTEFLGWCLVINTGLLLFSAVMIIALKNWVIAVHSKMFDFKAEDLNRAYFNHLIPGTITFS